MNQLIFDLIVLIVGTVFSIRFAVRADNLLNTYRSRLFGRVTNKEYWTVKEAEYKETWLSLTINTLVFFYSTNLIYETTLTGDTVIELLLIVPLLFNLIGVSIRARARLLRNKIVSLETREGQDEYK